VQLLLAVVSAVFREGISSWFKNLITKTFVFNTARLVFYYKNYIRPYKMLHISTGLTCPNFRWFYLSSRPANNLQSYACRVSCPVLLLVLKNLRITLVILHGMQLKCGSVLADMTEINVYM